jgi:hypothetical protein
MIRRMTLVIVLSCLIMMFAGPRAAMAQDAAAAAS